MNKMIAPSVLSADFGNLARDVEMINRSEADWIHVDIMDGVFVPNISFGLPVCKAIAGAARKPLDVHLMIVEPDRYLQAFKEAGAYMITVHAEACTHLHRTIEAIHALGCKAGVALNPHTPVSTLRDVAQMLDLLLIMSVNPGFGGQKFIANTLRKVAEAKLMLQEEGSPALIEVDGGVGLHNAGALFAAGADVLVAGNSVFSDADPVAAVAQLKSTGYMKV